jgi:hypothetical protein
MVALYEFVLLSLQMCKVMGFATQPFACQACSIYLILGNFLL